MQPPRAVFVDYPLGHTAGKAFDEADQDRILEASLNLLEHGTQPGEIRDLEARWAADGDDWKLPLLDPEAPDERTERRQEPQYERPADRRAAEGAEDCVGCIWLESSA